MNFSTVVVKHGKNEWENIMSGKGLRMPRLRRFSMALKAGDACRPQGNPLPSDLYCHWKAAKTTRSDIGSDDRSRSRMV